MKVSLSVITALIIGAASAPVFAATSITVSNPIANSTVGTPFVLAAVAAPCSSQPISAMGYSVDAGATTVVYASSMNAQVSASTGSHIVHVKSWGSAGAGCVTDVPVTVSSTAAAALFTDVTVTQPKAGAKLVSPFAVSASGSQCKSQPIAAIGYSIDDSSSTTILNGTTIATQVNAATGAHTLHIKTWGNQGSSCVNDLSISVVPSPVSTVPANAIAVNSIQSLTNWQAVIDTATGAGTSTYGTTSLNNSVTLSGTSRQFVTTYANYGGERYHISFGADTSSTNFLYDGWVYLPAPSTNIAILEFDMNQVMANGQTVIFGVQCDSWSKTWDITANTGTPQQPVDEWLRTSASCNLANWAPNTWHHVQMSYSRDSAGHATYKSIWLDNVQQDINVTLPDAFALGWGPALLTNFQVDGMTTTQQTVTAYLDKLTIYRW